MIESDPDRQDRKPRVVIVGPCASGKSTLAAALRTHGVDGYVCGQEHSIVRSLWRRREPDVVVVLEADLATIRRRRGDDWPEEIYRLQLERLAEARVHADLTLDSATMSVERMLAVVLRHLERRPPAAASGGVSSG